MTMTDPVREKPPADKPSRPPWMWVVFALGVAMFLVGNAGGSYAGKLGEVLKQDNTSFLPESADSTKVANEAPNFNDVQNIPGFVVYQRSGGLTGADQAKIAGDVAKFRTVEGVTAEQVAPPVFARDNKQVSGQAACDGRCDVATISVPLIAKQGGETVKFEDLGKTEENLLSTAKDGAPAGLTIKEAGAAGLIGAFSSAFDGLDTNLLFAALIVVFVILLIVYRSPMLPFIPLIASGLALSAASIVIYFLAKNDVITLDGQSQGILSVLVIGAGTDYALLFISRFREELHEIENPIEAIIAAWKGTFQPILASAVTVILGLICLSFAELKSTAGLGPVCAIGIAATVLVMLTVLPLLLLFFGRFGLWALPVVGWILLAMDFENRRMLDARWLFWPKKPRLDHETDMLKVHGVWGRFSQWLAAHSRRSWIGATVVMFLLVLAVTTLKTDGLDTKDSFTGTPDAVKGQAIYDANFDKGAGAPAQILVDADKLDATVAAAKKVQGIAADRVCPETSFEKVGAYLKANPGKLGTVFTPNGCAREAYQAKDRNGTYALINAPLTTSYDSSAAYATIDRLRSALSDVDGSKAYVGGQSAAMSDVQSASRSDRNLIIPIVLLVILVVLGLVLRAILAPLILIATVVLSFLASLGVSALFFNHVFDYENSDPGFPLFAFVFLVALGIDYNIFLMTRVREESIEHGTKLGITRGLAVTGGVITSAGIVLAATFVVLGIVPIVFLAQIGFTVAFGVLLDTIVVRSILVPALSHDIGKKIWWPSTLASASARD